MPVLSNMAVRDIETVIHPYTNLARHRETGPVVLDRGEGIYVYDDAGKRYIEGLAGLWCSSLGYANKELVDAAAEQMSRLSYSHVFAGKSHHDAIELSEKIKEIAPCPASKVLFCSGGSEANDMQVKLTWYYNNARGKPEKKKIISRIKGYHGVTVAAGSLTGLPAVQTDFDLPIKNVVFTSCPHFYRFGQDGESEEQFVARIVQSLRELIEREGPETIAAMIAEPVMGAGGVIVPPAAYYPAIQKVLDEHDIIMIDDEVINGFGRTGNWWGCETLGMRPTTISAAKQLTSAYAPLGAVMIPEDIYQAYVDHSRQIGTFGHGFTYGGHPLGCALGVKAIEIYQRRDIIGHVRTLAPVFEARMRKLAGNPLVGEARYCGLVGGVELVADRGTKRSFDAARGVGPQLTKFLEGRGAILRAIGDTIAICPPMIITEAELNELFDRLELALVDTEAWVAKEGLRAAA